MILSWTDRSLRDLERLYDFLFPVNPNAAIRIVRELSSAADKLLLHPQIGLTLPQFRPLQVRRLLVGQYEIRYQITAQSIFILQVWHTREDRT